MTFEETNILIATEADALAITALLNSAYRGESSRAGWTTEADFIGGEIRTNEADLIDVIEKEGSVILKYVDEQNTIIACVNLQKHREKLYLGMLSVKPTKQGGGIGKKMLAAVDAYAQHIDCTHIYMSVITIRSELIAWYMRHGFYDTGKKVPFLEDGKTGKHLRKLEFMVLEKKVV
jgi:ribosomal protein S18 acetylase RimI-like enzyme